MPLDAVTSLGGAGVTAWRATHLALIGDLSGGYLYPTLDADEGWLDDSLRDSRIGI